MIKGKLVMTGDLSAIDLQIKAASGDDWARGELRLVVSCATIEEACEIDRMLDSYVKITAESVSVPTPQEPV